MEETKNKVTGDSAPDVMLDLVDKEVGDVTIVPKLSAEEDRQLLRRIDLHLVPLLLFSYLFQTLDKSALSYSTIMGLETDLNLTGKDYSWASSIYYLGYLVFSYPASYLIVKFPIGKLIAGACVSWGAIIMISASSFNAGGLMVARFFLGVAEASIAPSLAVLVAMWYKKSEQPLRHGVWFMGNVIAGFFAALLAYAISKIKASVSPWVILFILFGGVTMLWGLCLIYLLPDHPSTARFLSAEDRQKAIIRVADNLTSIKDETFKKYQLVEGLLDIKMWLLFSIMTASSLANGLASFQSIIIKGMGFSTVDTYLIQMVSTAFQAIFVIIATVGSTYIKNSRTYFMMFNFTMGVIGAVMVKELDTSRLWARFFGYNLCIAFSGNYPLIFAMSTANFAGFTKKATVNAAIFVAYCAANVASPQFFISSESPAYPTGFEACLNKLRDRNGVVAMTPDEVDVALSLSDKTDFEIPQFRYVM
ncbi:major facilitator superfamily domain-containing protein [Xylariales sp. PMI_506]|nr:major facilitator superfamily domain-containing protein [Xylariales sp. PMI_506]